MNVKTLIEELRKFDLEAEIKISQDEEGNEFKKIDGVYETEEGIIIYPFG